MATAWVWDGTEYTEAAATLTTKVTLSNTNLTAGNTYLIMVSTHFFGELEVQHGSTTFPHSNSRMKSRGSGDEKQPYFYMQKWVAVASEDIKVLLGDGLDTTGEMYNTTILAWDLTDAGWVDGTDYWWVEDDAQEEHTTTYGVRATTTFTPANEDHLIIGSIQFWMNDDVQNLRSQFYANGSLIHYASAEGETHSGDEYYSWGSFVGRNLPASSLTVEYKTSDDADVAANNYHERSAIFVLPFSKVAEYQMGTGGTTTGAPTDGVSLAAFQPTTTGDFMIAAIASSSLNMNEDGEYKIQDNTTNWPSGWTTGPNATAHDNTDYRPHLAAGIAELSSATTYNFDTHMVSAGAVDSWGYQNIVVFSLDAAAGGTDATVTPAAIAVTTTTPGATASASSTVTPAAIAVTTTTPAATPSAGVTQQPAAIAVTTALPAATPSASSTVTPSAIAVTVALPQATPGVFTIVTPAAITVTAATPAATPSAGVTQSPAAVAATVTLPAPTVQGDVQVAPATITATVALPAATAAISITPTPAAIAATTTLPQVAGIDVGAGPGVVTATTALPAPAVQGDWTATPAAVAATVALPAATAFTGISVTPATVAATVTVNDSSVAGSDGYLTMDGTGDWAEKSVTPTTFPTDSTGIRIEAKIRMDDWTPASLRNIIAIEGNTLKDWEFRVDTSGNLQFYDNGAGAATSSTNTGFTDGTDGWIAVVDDNVNCKFYTSTDGTTWNQLGTNQTSQITSNSETGATFHVGNEPFDTASRRWSGRVYWVKIWADGNAPGSGGTADTEYAADGSFTLFGDAAETASSEQQRVHVGAGPSTVAATVALPAATAVAGDATVTPATVAATVTLPAVTASGAATVTPATIAATVTLPAATPAVDDTATPAAIAATTTVPAVTVAATTIVTPATIAATVALPAATALAGDITVTPATIAATVTVPAATPATTTIVTPAAIAATTTLPAATIDLGADVAPATIVSTVTLPAAAISTGWVAKPAATAAVTALPALTVTISSGARRVDAGLVATSRTATGLVGSTVGSGVQSTRIESEVA